MNIWIQNPVLPLTMWFRKVNSSPWASVSSLAKQEYKHLFLKIFSGRALSMTASILGEGNWEEWPCAVCMAQALPQSPWVSVIMHKLWGQLWFLITVLEVSTLWGGEVETSSSNRKGESASKRQVARGGGLATEPECGPAAGPALGGWGLRGVVSSVGFIQYHSITLSWAPTTCQPLVLETKDIVNDTSLSLPSWNWPSSGGTTIKQK